MSSVRMFQILDILRCQLQIVTNIQPSKVARVMRGSEVGGCRPVLVVFSKFSEVRISPRDHLYRRDGYF